MGFFFYQFLVDLVCSVRKFLSFQQGFLFLVFFWVLQFFMVCQQFEIGRVACFQVGRVQFVFRQIQNGVDLFLLSVFVIFVLQFYVCWFRQKGLLFFSLSCQYGSSFYFEKQVGSEFLQVGVYGRVSEFLVRVGCEFLWLGCGWGSSESRDQRF